MAGQPARQMELGMGIVTQFYPLGGQYPPHHAGDVLFESGTPGTYELDIPAANFKIDATGGGGGGGGSQTAHSGVGTYGGGGAAFSGIVRLGTQKLVIKIGDSGKGGYASGRNPAPGSNGSLSSIGTASADLITCGGGEGGTAGNGSGGSGSGGVLTLASGLQVLSSTVSSNGQARSNVSLLGNAYGKGGVSAPRATGGDGTTGYVRVTYMGR